jgi:hypothetical protein
MNLTSRGCPMTDTIWNGPTLCSQVLQMGNRSLKGPQARWSVRDASNRRPRAAQVLHASTMIAFPPYPSAVLVSTTL